VIYRNLILTATISSPDHLLWQWLAKRSGRIAGLELRLEVHSDDATEIPDWVQPLQTLSGIPGVQLNVTWADRIVDLDQPCVALWLK
jgi:hypothetical protein